MAETAYSRDSERILLALFEQPPMLTRELVESAGLDDTRQVHYRYSHYLGPDEHNLIRKHSDGRGGHAEWELTDAGEAWVEARYDDIKIPQTEDEAAEVAAKAHRISKSAISTASTTSHEFRQLEERVMGAVGDARETIDKSLEALQEADAQARRVARHEARAEVEELEDDIESINSELKNINSDRLTLQKNIKKAEERSARVETVVEIEDHLDSLEAHLDEQVARLDNIEETLEGVKSDVDALKTAVEANHDSIEELTDRLDGIEDRLDDSIVPV